MQFKQNEMQWALNHDCKWDAGLSKIEQLIPKIMKHRIRIISTNYVCHAATFPQSQTLINFNHISKHQISNNRLLLLLPCLLEIGRSGTRTLPISAAYSRHAKPRKASFCTRIWSCYLPDCTPTSSALPSVRAIASSQRPWTEPSTPLLCT